MSTPVHNNPPSAVTNHRIVALPKPEALPSHEAASPKPPPRPEALPSHEATPLNAAPKGPGNEHVQLRTNAPQPFSDRVLRNSTDARQTANALSTSLATDGAAGLTAHGKASPELPRLLNG